MPAILGNLPNAFTPASLAKHWKCSPLHIRNMVKRGDLEAIALGGKLLGLRGMWSKPMRTAATVQTELLVLLL